MLPDGNGGWICLGERDNLAGDPQLTWHHELVFVGAPIFMEKPLMVDDLVRLMGCRPKTTPFHTDLYVHFGCRRYTSTHT